MTGRRVVLRMKPNNDAVDAALRTSFMSCDSRPRGACAVVDIKGHHVLEPMVGPKEMQFISVCFSTVTVVTNTMVTPCVCDDLRTLQ